ncbi:MAG: hypothetical protein PHS93_07460 [Candidatus Omnitrophica bacterium]|nr:hypothetical protein [Candidatus Omnitrophota bacterium]MDD5352977.1 hypothetical protein [Candidatus Omnitrophota bacterium]MDD5550576.1 hypothetical protein [Candidatus Omnitrophota bacterium]
MMKRRLLFFGVALSLFLSVFCNSSVFAVEKVKLKLFYSPHCKACIVLKAEYIPGIISRYKDKIEIEYLDITEEEIFKSYSALTKVFNTGVRVPAILVGNHFLVGSRQIRNSLEPILKEYILKPVIPTVPVTQEDLLQKFRSFSPLTVIIAGLIDGINPCAFTVLIFFISFLTLMGYRKRDLAVIGLIFISSVFLTYLAIGLGLFKGLYQLKHFYTFLKGIYYAIAAFCFLLAYGNLRDFIEYNKTKNTDSLKVKLPKPVRLRINSIIAKFYRKDPQGEPVAKLSLITATFIVGFLISLLEAICTGQVYLPTIIFILKESSLRIKALSYLLLYNFMFIAPLLLILLLGVLGVSSKKLEGFFKEKLGLIKILMFILFLGLGIFLLWEI